MKKFALVLFAILVVASSAFAQLDPDDDGIGLYFDPCACVNCLPLDVGFHTAFLVITHPTSPGGVGGWEAEFTTVGPAAVTSFALEGNAVNAATRPNEYIVGCTEPLYNPYTYPAIVVAILEIYIENTDSPVNFYIDGIYYHTMDDKVPAYIDGGDYNIAKPLQQSTGGPDFPVATVNGECAVDVDTESWGGVKALYR